MRGANKRKRERRGKGRHSKWACFWGAHWTEREVGAEPVAAVAPFRGKDSSSTTRRKQPLRHSSGAIKGRGGVRLGALVVPSSAGEPRLQSGATNNEARTHATSAAPRAAPPKRCSPTHEHSPEPYFNSAELLPSSRRAMISNWICCVPSKMSRILASRDHFSSKAVSV